MAEDGYKFSGGTGGSNTSVSDATTTTKGIVKLAGALGGTADLPTVPGLPSLADRGNWTTSTAYVVGDTVTTGGIRYIVKTAHTSGTFLTDLGNSKLTALSLSNAVTAIGLKRDYSAKGDCRTLTDAVVTATTTLTSATGAFTQADVGKTVAIPYAGAVGASVRAAHITTVASVESGTSLTLTAAPSFAVTSARTVTDVAMSSTSSQNLTSATANFTTADVGKKITVPGAGWLQSDGTLPLTTRITSVTNSTTAVVQHRPQTTVSGQTVTFPGSIVMIGTDDGAALVAAAAFGCSTGRPVEVEPGNYLTTQQVEVLSKFSWYGHGAGVSIISPVGNTAPMAGFVNTAGTLITDVTFRNFEIDCTGTKVSTYSTTNKAIFLRPVTRLHIENMFIHDTSATAVGCDFLRSSKIINNIIDWPAVQYIELAASAGGAGIGLGTGSYTQEDTLISGNAVRFGGSKGIFAESQSSTVRSRGVRIIGNYVFATDIGIGDYATDGCLIEGNVADYCFSAGIRASNGFVTSLYSENGRIVQNYCNKCGIDITIKSGEYTIQDNVLVSAAIAATPATSAVVETIRIIGNSVKLAPNRGINLVAGGTSWNRAIVTGNKITDSGTSARAAIYSTATINNLVVKDNFAYDTRGTKFQSYGLELASGAITRLVYDGNDFADNLTGTELLTVTPGTTVTHFNP